MILLDKKNVKLEFEPDIPCITMISLGYMSSEEFREPFLIGLDFMEEKINEMPDISWLNDTRKQKTAKLEDVKWINSNVNERAYKMGVKKVAFVLPESAFGKLVIQSYVKITNSRIDNKLTIKAFKTVEKAKDWLKSKDGISTDEVKI